MHKSVALLLLCLPEICLSQQYIRLSLEEAVASVESVQGRVILSDQRKDCIGGNKFALLIADASLNYAGCWFYDPMRSQVYVKFASERQYKSYPAGAFKPMQGTSGSSLEDLFNGKPLTPEQELQARNARRGRLKAQ